MVKNAWGTLWVSKENDYKLSTDKLEVKLFIWYLKLILLLTNALNEVFVILGFKILDKELRAVV